MEERECIIALNTVDIIGGKRLADLMETFGSAEAIIKAKEKDLLQVRGVGQETAGRIKALRDGKAALREIKKAKESGVKIVTSDEPSYPAALLNTAYPPPVIYILGEILPADALAIAIVGSRRPTYYGRKVAGGLAKNAAEEGLTVVSGLARGIDSTAHEGALKGGGRTIAVLGSGIDVIYPPENRELAERITESGAVVSEFPFGSCPFRQNFPRRNRIISGLALGVVIVQAGESSGALITADFALEQGREVFAVPGEIGNPLSRGTHNLIRQGARLIEGIPDILEELGISAAEEHSIENKDSGVRLSSREKRVLSHLGFSPISTDDIVIATGFFPSEVTRALVSLEVKGIVTRVRGGWVRT